MKAPKSRLPVAVVSPRSSLKRWSPRSSVHTARPTKPVRLSLSTIASARNPTAGRDGPESTSDPLKSAMAACRSLPRGMTWRLPTAVHVPWNSRHSSPPEVPCDHVDKGAQVTAISKAANGIGLRFCGRRLKMPRLAQPTTRLMALSPAAGQFEAKSLNRPTGGKRCLPIAGTGERLGGYGERWFSPRRPPQRAFCPGRSRKRLG